MDRSYLRYVPRDTCGTVASNGIFEDASRAKFPASLFGKHNLKDAASSRLIFDAQAERVRLLDLENDCRVLASFDVPPREPIHGAPVYFSTEVSTLSLSTDGLKLAVGYADGTIRVWTWLDSLKKGQTDSGGDLSVMDLNPRQNLLYKRPPFGYKTHDDLFTNDGQDDDFESMIDYGMEVVSSVSLAGHSGAVRCLRWTIGDDLLVSSGSDGEIVVWDVDQMNGKFRLSDHSGPVNDIAFLYETISCSEATKDLPRSRTFDPKKPRWLLSCSKDSTMKLWDLVMQSCISTEAIHRREVLSMQVDRCNHRVVSVGSDGNVYVHEIHNLPGDLNHDPKAEVEFHLLGFVARDLRGGKVTTGKHAPAKVDLMDKADDIRKIKQLVRVRANEEGDVSRSSNADSLSSKKRSKKRSGEGMVSPKKKNKKNVQCGPDDPTDRHQLAEGVEIHLSHHDPLPRSWNISSKQHLCPGVVQLRVPTDDEFQLGLAVAFDVDLMVLVLPLGSISGRIELYDLLSSPSAGKKLKKRLKNSKKRREAMIKKAVADKASLKVMESTLPIAEDDTRLLEFNIAQGELTKLEAQLEALKEEIVVANSIVTSSTNSSGQSFSMANFRLFAISDILSFVSSSPVENTKNWITVPFNQRLCKRPTWREAIRAVTTSSTDEVPIVPEKIVYQSLSRGPVVASLLNPQFGRHTDSTTALSSVELPASQFIPSAPQWLVPQRNDEGFITGGESGQFKVWDLKTQRCIYTRFLESAKTILKCAVLLPDNEHLLSATNHGSVVFISVSTGETFATVDIGGEEITDLCSDADGKGFYVTTKNCQVRYFVMTATASSGDEDGHQVVTTEVQSRTLQSEPKKVVVTPDGKYVAVVMVDDTIVLLHANTLKTFVVLFGHKLPCRAISVSDDSSMIATGGDEKTIYIWGTDFGQIMKRISLAHEKSITALKFIPESHQIVSAGADALVKFWDVDNKICIQSLAGHGSYICAMGMLRDGSGVITCDSSKIIRTWLRTREPLMIKDEMRGQLELKDEDALLKNVNHRTGLFSDVAFSKASRPSTDAVRSADKVSEVIDKCWQGVILIENGQDVTEMRFEGDDPLASLSAALRSIPNSHLYDCIVTLPQADIMHLLELITLLLEQLIRERGCEAGSRAQKFSIEGPIRTALLIISSHLRQFLFNDGGRALIDRLKRSLTALLDDECDAILCNIAACSLVSRQADETG
eukprot:GHVH01001299.1.p1 GENE.GHVH01001299.1~~GHVH01001299.1.p1  ORF type:complete len:1215 (-),score=212.58 GHVH01001299.1:80-3724(-)